MSDSVYLVATRSAGKLRELRALFAADGVRVIDLQEAGIPESTDEAAIEAFDTFEANALAKAEYFHHRTKLPTFADDSGLAIHALGGAPGVYSKRWSQRADLIGHALDTANNAKLIEALSTLPSSVRPEAEYICAAAFVDFVGRHVCLGRTRGRMTLAPAGEQGFGYDPYFYSEELHKSFAKATVEEKQAVSHRGRAFVALLRELRQGGRFPADATRSA